MTKSAFGMRGDGRISGSMNNNRGVALLIVLLVTALLTALIVEFAFGTRVSLRAAVNFRDSQRAYFLARSGVNAVGMYLSKKLENKEPQVDLEMREPWPLAALIPGNDMTLDIRWYDEGGKISITSMNKGNDAYNRLSKLFEILGINQNALDLIIPTPTDSRKFYLLTELHQFLSDEEFEKIKDMVTVAQVEKIDINTASSEVLQSLGLSPALAGTIKERRSRELFVKTGDINEFPGMNTNMTVVGMLDVTSNVFKVRSVATVGGYTKTVEAVIKRTASSFDVQYWSAL